MIYQSVSRAVSGMLHIRTSAVAVADRFDPQGRCLSPWSMLAEKSTLESALDDFSSSNSLDSCPGAASRMLKLEQANLGQRVAGRLNDDLGRCAKHKVA